MWFFCFAVALSSEEKHCGVSEKYAEWTIIQSATKEIMKRKTGSLWEAHQRERYMIDEF
jgi:hypothetical protein